MVNLQEFLKKNVFNQQDVTKIAESSKNNKTSEGDNSINNEVKASHKEKLETKKTETIQHLKSRNNQKVIFGRL